MYEHFTFCEKPNNDNRNVSFRPRHDLQSDCITALSESVLKQQLFDVNIEKDQRPLKMFNSAPSSYGVAKEKWLI